jgi:hypothetical protein
VDQYRPDPDNIGGLDGAQDGIFKSARPKPFLCQASSTANRPTITGGAD